MSHQLDIYLFHRGENLKSYNYMGAHIINQGVIFRVWAPNAKSVSVVGNFNNWDGSNHKMNKINSEGIWELEIPSLTKYEIYKYEIETFSGLKFFKSDPYAFYSELRPHTASIVYDIPSYNWTDKNWLDKRTIGFTNPVNIYEIHLGSWQLNRNGEFLTYHEIADKIIPYLKEMNYTHLEIMPIYEYPLDMSWGYQGTGFFSVTSRYGTPEDFMYLVNELHKNNIGIILDWVPGHFCKDSHGLYHFDGQPLYEYSDSRIMENKTWGTANFDLGRNEVKSFLISNAFYWLEIFHIDGIRMDAVANMLYLNYGGKENVTNKYGGIENLDSIDFLKHLNSVVHKNFPDVMLIAEDSTAWPLVTKYPEDGGLGFDGKWNMGWMNDTLEYMASDPIYRKNLHGKLTFSFMYAFTENFILPLSHDEVVHGKNSILNKMPGFYEDKLKHIKNLYSYQIAHPGKKLTFMGNEIAQGLEWRYDSSIEWHLVYENPGSINIQKYVKALNKMYRTEKSFWYDGADGFEWIEHENFQENILIFMRKIPDFSEHIIVAINFSGVTRENYKIGVPLDVNYELILNSDDPKYGGFNILEDNLFTPIIEAWNFRTQHIKVTIPANSSVFLKAKKK